MIDFYGYGTALSGKNSSLLRNWTQNNGLPNYIAHFEMAKYIAKFLGREESGITTAGGETLSFTNPSASTGHEKDNITPIYSSLAGSTDTKVFDVTEIESCYSNDRVVYYYLDGGKSIKVYGENGSVTIEHNKTGDYTFGAFAISGSKKVYFNDVKYKIEQIDEVQNTPQYFMRTTFFGSDYSNAYFRNQLEHASWQPLVPANTVQLAQDCYAVRLAPSGSNKLVGIKQTFAKGLLEPCYNKLAFTLSAPVEGVYTYRVWYYKDDDTFAEFTTTSGKNIYISSTATTFYYDITSVQSIYPDIIGFSVQLTNTDETVFLHNFSVISTQIQL